MKGVILDGYTINPGDLSWGPVTDLCPCEIYDRTPNEEAVQRIGDCEAVFSSKVVLNAQVMDACPNLRYIGVLATGYNQVDLAAAKARGITVCNVPNYSTDAVVQFTFALLLELCCRVAHHDSAIRGERGRSATDFCWWDFPQLELAGRTMGLIGFGNIGRKVAAAAHALGMKVLVYTPHPKAEEETDWLCFASLEQVMSQSDVISLHCPLTPENTRLINEETLSLVKPSALLLNTARGGLVDEDALAAALNEGRLAGAAVDVVAREPARAETCPLLSAKNCIVTPHIAWATQEARARLIQITGDNLAAWLKGDPINVVV